MRILLIGPTAAGKTALSVDLAKKLDAEIISADSRQSYKYLNIGTATPDSNERGTIPHYNLSVIDPGEKDSAAAFYERTKRWEEDILERGKNVLYVGGSTLHIQCIIQPLDEVPEADEENLSKLEQEAEKHGIEKLYNKLLEVDPGYADKMDGMNPHRIYRALDVWMQTGKPFSSFHSEGEGIEVPGDMLVFGLRRNRKTLHERINERVDEMFEKGFLDEVQALLEMGYTREDPGLNSVGYRDAIAYLNGDLSREKMIRDMKTQTRRYAKRQLTWFGRWDFIRWINLDACTAETAREIIMRQVAAKLNKD